MLRVSADLSNKDADLDMINGEQPDDTSGVEHAVPLMKFAEAVASGNESELARAREDLLQAAGPEALVDAAAVAGNFQRMVRIADATGIPLDDHLIVMAGSVGDELNLRRFETAGHSALIPWYKRFRNVLLRPFLIRVLRRLDGKRQST